MLTTASLLHLLLIEIIKSCLVCSADLQPLTKKKITFVMVPTLSCRPPAYNVTQLRFIG